MAHGVEFDENAVAVAHSGIVAEGFSPQLQVIQGDAWDLANNESKLFDAVKKLGPFDLVYSYAVVDGGSGFPEAIREKADEQTKSLPEEESYKEYSNLVLKGLYGFYAGVDKLLSKDGIQLHTAIGDRGTISYMDYRFADANLIRKINESIVDNDVRQIAIPAGSIKPLV